ncbi:hypothetical protein F1643_04490 [Azospirillum sp. INR13]|uniref:hypothetical protein n=1 Tax=Azospirillum sp. INR13 TaxID=2596919 RepID=UPI00189216AB|nr:hypothetical protein [Azospirillum sp. INR13]
MDLSQAGVWKTARFTVTATGGDDRLSFRQLGRSGKARQRRSLRRLGRNLHRCDGFGSNQSDDLAVLTVRRQEEHPERIPDASNVNQLIQASAGFGSTDAWMSATDAQINGYGATFNTILSNAPKLVA